MSVFAEFHVPTDAFALSRTLERVPEAVIEIERVVATEELMSPYFWVSGGDRERFRDAARADPTVRNLTELDPFEETVLYRAEWTENIESVLYAYTRLGANLFEATGTGETWELRMRFDTHDDLEAFQTYCAERGLSYDLRRLHELSHPMTASQYGLTEKQRTALVAAWEAGYFETPRRATLEEIAAELGITQQSLSDRLRRGHHALIASTLAVTPPGETPRR